MCRRGTDKVHAMKPAAVAELKAPTERECAQTPHDMFHVFAIPLFRVVEGAWVRNGCRFESGS